MNYFIKILFGCLLLTIINATEIPDYIKVCKRDQDTINKCVKRSIEILRPKLIDGIPELNVPSIEPLHIPEIVVDQGDVIRFKAIGNDIKMYGASNFKIKSLDVDLETLEIKSKTYFPNLDLIGKYDLDARLLAFPVHGKGDIEINTTKCNADMFMQGALEDKNGETYFKFSAINIEIDIQDYSIRVTNVFNGNLQLGDMANQIVNQNQAHFLQAAKPYIERTCSNIIKKIANRIAGSAKYDEILPES